MGAVEVFGYWMEPGANLRGANLRGATFFLADLTGALGSRGGWATLLVAQETTRSKTHRR